MQVTELILRNLVSLSRYEYRDRTIHRVHPVAKIALVAVSLGIAIAMDYSDVLLALAVLATLAVYSLGLGRVASLTLSVLVVFAPMVLFVYLYSLVALGFSTEVLASATASIAVALARIVVMVLSFSILLLTTRPQSIARVLNRARVPYVYVYGVVMALRLILVLISDMQEIYMVQRIRGLKTPKGLVSRIKSYLALFIPMVISALNRADELSLSLELKGFGYKPVRSYLYVEEVGLADIALVSLTIGLLFITLLL